MPKYLVGIVLATDAVHVAVSPALFCLFSISKSKLSTLLERLCKQFVHMHTHTHACVHFFFQLCTPLSGFRQAWPECISCSHLCLHRSMCARVFQSCASFLQECVFVLSVSVMLLVCLQ